MSSPPSQFTRTEEPRREPGPVAPEESDPDTPCFPSAKVLQLVADGTRRAIVTTLWTAEDTPLRFSALRRRAGVERSSRFNYHLQQLLGRFVRDTGDGYVLTTGGERFVGALHAAPALDPAPDGETTGSD